MNLMSPTSTTSVEAAIEEADLNALRMAVLQVTGDRALADMEVEQVPYAGGFSHHYRVAPKHVTAIKEAATRFLQCSPVTPPPIPSKTETRRLMSLFTGEPLTDTEFEFGYEELALEDFPHEANWSREVSSDELAGLHVVVIGAGIGGLAMGIQLDHLGIPYTILERQDGVGGTWLLNDYPEARVDVASFHYQFRFEKSYPWKEHYATQAEMQKYLNHIVTKYGVGPNIRTGVEVRRARWDEDASEWSVDYVSKDGVDGTLRANFVISCSGLFSTPKIPDFPGMSQYEERLFHTSEWDHEFDLSGKSVAIIGNGSSGAQVMPHLAAHAEHLSVFQRTPQWMSPRSDYRDTVSEEHHWLFRTMPYYWNWFVYGQFHAQIGLQKAQEFDGTASGEGHVNKWNDALWVSLSDYIHQKFEERPDLLEQLLPDYAPLGRRLVVDNGWYDAIGRPNVELVTSPIATFAPHGVTTADGRHRRFDLVVLATGFEVAKYFHPVKYVGRDGATLDELWAKDGARSYLGLTVPDLPNFFSFYGPNGQARAGGYHFWAEAWSRYAATAITRLIENDWRSVAVKRSAYDDYNARLDEAMTKLLWAHEGSGSYYVNDFGRPGVNMPWRADHYNKMIQTPNFDDFVVRPGPRRAR